MGEYADVNGIRLYRESRGTGRPLVLLHGGLGATEMFEPIHPALAKGRRVIAVTCRATAAPRPTSIGRSGPT